MNEAKLCGTAISIFYDFFLKFLSLIMFLFLYCDFDFIYSIVDMDDVLFVMCVIMILVSFLIMFCDILC